ncbi:exodeoxyribonuclease V subunit alpha [Ferrimonas lipolytica]|uniref:RecBCD enzyme subunit RecD n=1 Tax=Ferrimonas lipolytica TaxID=2724191 RepID=A0A6H1UE35_9GAMM|nr:exodeoxyribonuclease V subunit alpha [Ferrimonas lipolytica]QIZ76889.1 exodeoxyribonuclease V subunit alpha [Ferrimonas lipolytica]
MAEVTTPQTTLNAEPQAPFQFGPKPLPTELVPLEQYQQLGWLRQLDLALVRLLQQQGETNPAVLTLAALASHQVGRGHICLDLTMLLNEPQLILGLPPQGREFLAPSLPQHWLQGITLEQLLSGLEASTVVDNDNRGSAPLVLSGALLYLRRYYEYEVEVAAVLTERLQQQFELPEDLPHRLNQLFAPLKDSAENDGSSVHWQSVAAALAARAGVSVISGGPGTGKTTTVVRLLALLQSLALEQQGSDGTGLRIQLAAPTGKAAARLSESLSGTLSAIRAGNVAEIPTEIAELIPAEVATLHRLLGARPDSRFFRHHRSNPLHLDVLVVDEASMVDLEMMASLLAAVPPTARLILLGDKDQLSSVEAGAVLGDLCQFAEQGRYQADTQGFVYRASGYDLSPWVGAGTSLEQQVVMLRKSHRFGADSGIGQLASAVNRGDVDQTRWQLMNSQGDLAFLSPKSTQDSGFDRLLLDGDANGLAPRNGHSAAGYRRYLQLVNEGVQPEQTELQWQQSILTAFGEFQLLAAIREGEWGVSGLNQRIATLLKRKQLISDDKGWYAGRPVMVMRNDYSVNLMNGDVGICLPSASDGGQLRVVFPMPDGSLKAVLPSRLSSVETVFAMTVHKSQGSEFSHTALVLPDKPNPVLTRELIYTGITRAKLWFSLVISDGSLVAEAIRSQTVRSSGLSQRLGF